MMRASRAMEFHFSALDYVVFLAVLLMSAGVGVFYAVKARLSKGSESVEGYLMGDRRLPLIPVALSLLVSFQSAILVLGSSSEMYVRGTTYWWVTVGMALSALLTCFLFVPVFYYLRLTSVYEYLEVRFHSRLVRQLGAAFYTIVTLIYLSIAIYAPSVALAAVSPFPLWALILSAGAVCTFYVSVGGMKAVIWTDALQAGFMLAGLLAIAIKGTSTVGGIGRVWSASRAGGRLVYFDARTDPTLYMTSWGVIFGQLFSWLGWYGINQSSVQRYCGMKTVAQGQLALVMNIPAIFMAVSLVCYCGLVMYTYFLQCDPLQAGIIKDRDELLPMFVMEVLGSARGVPGLFVACLYAGTLSTVSSGLNSLAAVVWQDFLKSHLGSCSVRQATYITKFLCLFFGVIATCLSFLAPYLGGVLQAALSTMGAINGPLTGIFLLGVTVPWANKKGAIAGALVSIVVCVWLCVGAHVYAPHSVGLATSVAACAAQYNVSVPPTPLPTPTTLEGLSRVYATSYVLYDMIGILIVMVVAVPVSWATGFEDVRRLNPQLFHPLLRRLVSHVDGRPWGAEPHAQPQEKDDIDVDEQSASPLLQKRFNLDSGPL